MKFFLVGSPGIGKSTILQNAVSQLKVRGYKVGGISSPEIREDGSRVGFEIVDLLSGKRGTLSRIGWASGPSIGKYRVNLADLSQIGVTALNDAIKEADLIVVDEIGPMELQGKDFQEAIIKAVGSSKPMLGIIHWRIKHPLVEKIKGRSDVKIYEITHESREAVQAKVMEEILNVLRKKS